MIFFIWLNAVQEFDALTLLIHIRPFLCIIGTVKYVTRLKTEFCIIRPIINEGKESSMMEGSNSSYYDSKERIILPTPVTVDLTMICRKPQNERAFITY